MSDIEYWFHVTDVPTGSAPDWVRKEWVDVVLPVRRPRPVEGPESHLGIDVMDRTVVHPIADGVAVGRSDALRALTVFGRDEAAAWWELHLRTRPATSHLVFRTHEGRLLPPTMARMLHPEVFELDESWGPSST